MSNFDIFIKHSTSGWLELVHHFEMVVLSFPSCSASHKPVFFFSTSNSFRRFNSLCVIIFILYRKITNYYQQTCKNSLIFMLCSQQVENYSIVLCLFRGLNYNISLSQKQHIMPDTLTFTSVHTIPGAHASAAFTSKTSEVFKEEHNIAPIIINDKMKYIPWGGDNQMPYNIIDLRVLRPLCSSRQVRRDTLHSLCQLAQYGQSGGHRAHRISQSTVAIHRPSEQREEISH